MHAKENPAGGPGMGQRLVKHIQELAQRFTVWAICQDWVMLAAILAGAVL